MKFEISGELFRDVMKAATLTKTTKPFTELVKLETKKDTGLQLRSMDLSSVVMSYVLIRNEHINILEEGEGYIEPKDVINVLTKTFKKDVITFETDNERFYIKTDEENKWYGVLSSSDLEFATDFIIEDGIPKPKGGEFTTTVKISEPPTILDLTASVELSVENGKCRLKMGDEVSGLIKTISLRSSGENITIRLDTEYIKRIFDLVKGESILYLNSDYIHVVNPRDWGVVCYLLVTMGEE